MLRRPPNRLLYERFFMRELALPFLVTARRGGPAAPAAVAFFRVAAPSGKLACGQEGGAGAATTQPLPRTQPAIRAAG